MISATVLILTVYSISTSWIAVSFGQNAEGLEAADAVLNAHSEAAQSVIIGALIFCQGSCLGFLVGDIDAGVVFLKPLIATVGIDV